MQLNNLFTETLKNLDGTILVTPAETAEALHWQASDKLAVVDVSQSQIGSFATGVAVYGLQPFVVVRQEDLTIQFASDWLESAAKVRYQTGSQFEAAPKLLVIYENVLRKENIFQLAAATKVYAPTTVKQTELLLQAPSEDACVIFVEKQIADYLPEPVAPEEPAVPAEPAPEDQAEELQENQRQSEMSAQASTAENAMAGELQTESAAAATAYNEEQTALAGEQAPAQPAPEGDAEASVTEQSSGTATAMAAEPGRGTQTERPLAFQADVPAAVEQELVEANQEAIQSEQIEAGETELQVVANVGDEANAVEQSASATESEPNAESDAEPNAEPEAKPKPKRRRMAPVAAPVTHSFDQAQIKQPGDSVTVIAYGTALQACENLAMSNPGIELIQLVALAPLDVATCLHSVKKTGRCIIVQDSDKTFGVASELAAALAEHALDFLYAPVRRVGAIALPEHHAVAESAVVETELHKIVQELLQFS